MVMSSFFCEAQNKKAIQWEIQADTLMGQEDYEGALSFYNKVINKTKLKVKTDYAVLYKRALAYFHLNALDKALRDLSQYLLQYGEDEAYLLLAYIHQGSGNSTDLLTPLDTLMQRYPDNVDIAKWRAEALMNAGKYNEARNVIQKIPDVQSDPDLLLSLGVAHFYSQSYDSAFLVFDDIIKENPEQIEPYLYAASLCLEEELYELALSYINAGLQHHSNEYTLFFYKGIALYELKNIDEGCMYMKKAFYNGIDDAADYLKELFWY